jgi:hypothetical protein
MAKCVDCACGYQLLALALNREDRMDNTHSEIESVEQLIHEVRGRKVMIDVALAALYGVTTKRLNEQVKRNLQRFPDDFMIRLTVREYDTLGRQGGIPGMRSQFATSKGRGGRRYLPFAFTEHGAIMAANVLNTPKAVHMSVFVVRAFVKMRSVMVDTRGMARKLAVLEKELKGRLDVHESVIVTILQRVMDIIDPPDQPDPPRKKIGFGNG